MHFDPSRLQKGKAGSRLKEAVEIIVKWEKKLKK